MKFFVPAITTFALLALSPSYADVCRQPIPTHCATKTKPVTCLFQLIQQRECLMKAVAANKYIHHGSVYDAAQEIKVLLNVANKAKKAQLNATDLQVFAQVQTDLSKQIESYWMNYWKTADRKPTPSKTLAQLRKNIITLDSWTLPVIKKSLPTLGNPKNYPALKNNALKSLTVTGLPKKPRFQLLLLKTLTQIQSPPK